MENRLKKLRKTLRLNQTEFAAKLEMAQSSYSQVETGLINLTGKNIKLICHIFGINESWLRNGNGNMFVTRDTAETTEEKVLLTIYGRLTEEMQEFFLDLGQKLLSKDEASRGVKNEVDNQGSQRM